MAYYSQTPYLTVTNDGTFTPSYTLLDAPAILSPDNRAILCRNPLDPTKGTDVEIEWEAVSGASEYIVQISENSQFNGPTTKALTESGTSKTLVVGDDLQYGKEYFFRIFATSSSGVGPSTETRQFSILCEEFVEDTGGFDPPASGCGVAQVTTTFLDAQGQPTGGQVNVECLTSTGFSVVRNVAAPNCAYVSGTGTFTIQGGNNNDITIAGQNENGVVLTIGGCSEGSATLTYSGQYSCDGGTTTFNCTQQLVLDINCDVATGESEVFNSGFSPAASVGGRFFVDLESAGTSPVGLEYLLRTYTQTYYTSAYDSQCGVDVGRYFRDIYVSAPAVANPLEFVTIAGSGTEGGGYLNVKISGEEGNALSLKDDGLYSDYGQGGSAVYTYNPLYKTSNSYLGLYLAEFTGLLTNPTVVDVDGKLTTYVDFKKSLAVFPSFDDPASSRGIGLFLDKDDTTSLTGEGLEFSTANSAGLRHVKARVDGETVTINAQGELYAPYTGSGGSGYGFYTVMPLYKNDEAKPTLYLGYCDPIATYGPSDATCPDKLYIKLHDPGLAFAPNLEVNDTSGGLYTQTRSPLNPFLDSVGGVSLNYKLTDLNLFANDLGVPNSGFDLKVKIAGEPTDGFKSTSLTPAVPNALYRMDTAGGYSHDGLAVRPYPEQALDISSHNGGSLFVRTDDQTVYKNGSGNLYSVPDIAVDCPLSKEVAGTTTTLGIGLASPIVLDGCNVGLDCTSYNSTIIHRIVSFGFFDNTLRLKYKPVTLFFNHCHSYEVDGTDVNLDVPTYDCD